MSKIVRVVNAMIIAEDKISNVIASGKEVFFLFDGQYTWSIMPDKDKNSYKLFFYPKIVGTEYLASLDGPDWEDVTMVVYSTEEINTKEALDSFSELYNIVSEKVHGVDNAFNDILNKYESY